MTVALIFHVHLNLAVFVNVADTHTHTHTHTHTRTHTRTHAHTHTHTHTHAHTQVFSLHPGTVVTEVARSLPSFIVWLYKNLACYTMMDSKLGSDTTIHVATDPDLDSSFGGAQ